MSAAELNERAAYLVRRAEEDEMMAEQYLKEAHERRADAESLARLARFKQSTA